MMVLLLVGIRHRAYTSWYAPYGIYPLSYTLWYTMISEEGKQEVHPLKQIRSDLGLTQAQFAGLLSVQVTTVSRWETGQRQAELDLDQVVTIDLALAKLGKRISDYVVGQSPETQNV